MARKFGTAILLPADPGAPLEAATKSYTDAGDAGRQPIDADLTAIAAIAPTNDDVIQRKSGAWTSRTMTQLLTDVGAPPTSRLISAGTGLAGGGSLAADRTLTVAYGSSTGTAVQGDDARVTADQVAGTASIRTLGTGAQQAAVGSHAHVVAPAPVTLTDAATIATNAALGRYFRVTLTASRTLGNPTNLTDGPYTWEIIQDATGGWAMTFDTMFAFGTELSSVTLTTLPTKRDFLGGIYNSTTGLIYLVSLMRGY